MTSIRKVDCMKYFKEEELYSGSIGSAIVMLNDVDDERDVFTIEKLGNFINFVEGRDHYFSRMMSKEEAIEALKEAIAWIESEE